MKSEWKVTCDWLCGEKVYSVYRLLDTTEVDNSGNREYIRDFIPDEKIAQQLADSLNALSGQVCRLPIPKDSKKLHDQIDILRYAISKDTDIQRLAYHQRVLDELKAAAGQEGR